MTIPSLGPSRNASSTPIVISIGRSCLAAREEPMATSAPLATDVQSALASRPEAALLGVVAAVPLAISPFIPALGPWVLVWGTPFIAMGIARRAFGASKFMGFLAGFVAVAIAWSGMVSAGAAGMLIPLCAYEDPSMVWKPALAAALPYLLLAAAGGYSRRVWAWSLAALAMPVAYGIAFTMIGAADAPSFC